MTFAERIKEIEEREKRATPGEWQANRDSCDWNFPFSYSVYRGENDLLPIQIQSEGTAICIGKESPRKEASKIQCASDAEFIAHSRQDIPFLLEAVKRMGEALEWYSNPNHWEWTTHESTRDGCSCMDVSTYKFPLQAPIQVGGKHAREAIADLDKFEEH